MMIQLNSELFEKYIREGSQLVLVEYWAPWCVYCRRIAPALQKLSEQLGNSVIIGQVNIDDEPLLASQEHIEVIPTLVLYHNGEPVGSIVAPESKAKIEEFVKKSLEK